MSSKSFGSDQCAVSDDSEFNYIPGNYSVIEFEIMEASDGKMALTIKMKTQVPLKLMMVSHIHAILWQTNNGYQNIGSDKRR